MNPTAVDQMRKAWFTVGMDPGVVDRLAEIGEVREVPADATIVAAGAPCAALGLILSGCVALRTRLPGDLTRTILTLEDGDIIGWSAILPTSVATATATAVMPTRLMLFERDKLAGAMAADCDLALAVHRRVLVAVARRLQATRLQLLDLYRPEREPW